MTFRAMWLAIVLVGLAIVGGVLLSTTGRSDPGSFVPNLLSAPACLGTVALLNRKGTSKLLAALGGCVAGAAVMVLWASTVNLDERLPGPYWLYLLAWGGSISLARGLIGLFGGWPTRTDNRRQ